MEVSFLRSMQSFQFLGGILSGRTSLQGSPAKVSYSRHPSLDFIQGPIYPNTASSTFPTESVPDSSTIQEQHLATEATGTPEKTECEVDKKAMGALAILDPANFTLDAGKSTNARQRVTKESFLSGGTTKIGTDTDPDDPLSRLDPLWSLTK